MDQDTVFCQSEGDHWFKRNSQKLFAERDDVIVTALEQCGVRPQTVLEVGCSNGWRLEKIRKLYGADGYGIDASHEAIRIGRESFPALHLKQCGLNELTTSKKFDLVICSFVLHWISRQNIMKAVSNINDNLNGGGYWL